MRTITLTLALCGLLVAGFAAAASAQVTPRLWGTSYAIAMSPDHGAISQRSAVRVSVRLPQDLFCANVLSLSRQAVDLRDVLRDPLLGAPVSVVVAPGPCRGDWRDGWADFVVPGPTGSDILDVALVSPDGQLLLGERIAVETSVAAGGRR